MRTFNLSSLGRLIPVGCAAILLSLLAGCTTFQPHEGTRAAENLPAIPIRADDWPARNMKGLAEMAAATPHEIFTLVSNGLPPTSPVPESIARFANRPAATVTYSAVHGKGILRVFEYPGNEHDLHVPSLGTMRFFSRSTRADRPVDPHLVESAERLIRSWIKRLATLGCGLKPVDPETLRILSDGTAIRVIGPAKNVPSCGTIVYMSGLGSARFEQPLMDELGRRGWWLVKVATPRVWWYESQPWYIGSRADVPRVAQKLAGVLDDLVAEPAYAAEAALDYLATHHPEIPQSPMVMMGCSAGALASPTVVARMPRKFDAAVLIGAGANLLEITQKSDLTNAGIRLAWPDDQPHGAWREQLFRDYLKYSKLDPYHTARFLRDKPVLMLQANLDMTVPASNGWLLWNRLGCPDRYEHVGEHRTLFLTLGSQSKRIADWLAEQMAHRVRRDPIAHAPSPTPVASFAIGGGMMGGATVVTPGLIDAR